MDLGFVDIRKHKYTKKRGINKKHIHKHATYRGAGVSDRGVFCIFKSFPPLAEVNNYSTLPELKKNRIGVRGNGRIGP